MGLTSSTRTLSVDSVDVTNDELYNSRFNTINVNTAVAEPDTLVSVNHN